MKTSELLEKINSDYKANSYYEKSSWTTFKGSKYIKSFYIDLKDEPEKEEDKKEVKGQQN